MLLLLLQMEDISFDEPVGDGGESGDELNEETFGVGLDSGDEDPLHGLRKTLVC